MYTKVHASRNFIAILPMVTVVPGNGESLNIYSKNVHE